MNFESAFFDKSELREIFYEPAKKYVVRLEENQDKLTFDDRILLEKLKCSLKIYEIERSMKGY